MQLLDTCVGGGGGAHRVAPPRVVTAPPITSDDGSGSALAKSPLSYGFYRNRACEAAAAQGWDVMGGGSSAEALSRSVAALESSVAVAAAGVNRACAAAGVIGEECGAAPNIGHMLTLARRARASRGSASSSYDALALTPPPPPRVHRSHGGIPPSSGGSSHITQARTDGQSWSAAAAAADAAAAAADGGASPLLLDLSGPQSLLAGSGGSAARAATARLRIVSGEGASIGTSGSVGNGDGSGSGSADGDAVDDGSVAAGDDAGDFMRSARGRSMSAAPVLVSHIAPHIFGSYLSGASAAGAASAGGRGDGGEGALRRELSIVPEASEDSTPAPPPAGVVVEPMYLEAPSVATTHIAGPETSVAVATSGSDTSSAAAATVVFGTAAPLVVPGAAAGVAAVEPSPTQSALAKGVLNGGALGASVPTTTTTADVSGRMARPLSGPPPRPLPGPPPRPLPGPPPRLLPGPPATPARGA